MPRVPSRLVSRVSADALACGAPPEAARPDLDREAANRQVVERFVAAVNARDFDALDELVASDVVRHSPSTPGLVVTSREQLVEFLRADIAAVPDVRNEIRTLVTEGDMVAIRATYVGTQTGPMGPFLASGNRVDTEFAGFLRIEEGQIAELWVVWDNVAFLTQLGHMTPPGAPSP